MNETEKLIRKVKIKLFTNSLIFFGMCANKFSWKIEEFDPALEGYVTLDKLTNIESGNIYINKYYIDNNDYDHNNLAYLICHELLHILNKHGLRIEQRKKETWNVACDHVIESYLKKNLSHIIKPYQNKYNIINEIEQSYPNCTAEFVYNWLEQNESKIKINPAANSLISVCNGETNQLLFNVKDNIDHTNNESNDQFIREARALFQHIKNKGNIGSSLITYLDNILKVNIPWDTIVEKSIKTNVIMKPDDRSWRRLNKYFTPHKINLPGQSLIEDVEGTGIIIIGCDSSASINNNTLKKFSSIIEKSMEYYKSIHLLVHDVEIQQRKIFDKETIHEFYKFLSNSGYTGRGGTSHKYLFREIQDEYWENNKNELSMVISLTDGFSDIEEFYDKYEWIKNKIPLIFIITEEGTELNLDPTIGAISQIRINKY